MDSRILRTTMLVLAAASVSCSDNDQGASAVSAPPPNADFAIESTAVPNISARSYAIGSAKVAVTGAFQIDADIPLNTQASLSDGEMTWLQYGVSGAEDPNALLTVSTYEVGLSVAHGRPTATAGSDICSGGMQVTATSITGRYACQGVTSYDPASGQMGTVNIEMSFSALSK